MTRVIHIKDKELGGSTFSNNEVYIGRPSKWGNPFIIGKDGNRDEVIAKYEEYITYNDKLISNLHSLQGKDLVCYCKPQACHGDVLVKLVDRF